MEKEVLLSVKDKCLVFRGFPVKVIAQKMMFSIKDIFSNKYVNKSAENCGFVHVY